MTTSPQMTRNPGGFNGSTNLRRMRDRGAMRGCFTLDIIRRGEPATMRFSYSGSAVRQPWLCRQYTRLYQILVPENRGPWPPGHPQCHEIFLRFGSGLRQLPLLENYSAEGEL